MSEGPPMLDQSTVHQRLQEMARRDPGFTIIRSESHRYRLGPPLPQRRVGAFEREMGIDLPADYRSFLPGSETVAPGRATA